MSISERRACAALWQHRSTQRKVPRGREDEEHLTDDLVALARRHGRLGYRKIAALLHSTAGWIVNDKRVERISRQEGLKVPPRQPKRSRIWQSDGSCIRLRAYIEPGSPWENGYIESFNARLRDELLDGDIFYTLAEARIIIESWRRFYNRLRPHGSLGYKAPAPEVFIPAFARTAAQFKPASPPALAPKPSMN